MSRSSQRTFMSDFRTFFLRGLAVLLPSVITIWIVVQAYRFLHDRVAEPINGGVREVVIWTVPRVVDPSNQPEWFLVNDATVEREISRRRAEGLPVLQEEQVKLIIRRRALTEWWNQHAWLDLIGILIALMLFYLAGRILGGFLGRRITARFESGLGRVPVIRQIFPYVKQVVEFVLGERQIEFKRVAIVQYPRAGIWSLGFVTGTPMREVVQAAQQELVTMFIPSSPTPFTGYTITVPRSEIVEVNISVEEALRFTVTGGVLVPKSERVDAGEMEAIIRTSNSDEGPDEEEKKTAETGGSMPAMGRPRPGASN
ncbi:MAG: DUF502 domain-containing protein [Phycisphaerales bacterium]